MSTSVRPPESSRLIAVLKATALAVLLGGVMLIAATQLYAQQGDDPFRNAESLIREGKYADARALMAPLAARNDAQAHYWIGRSAFAEKRFGDAAKSFERAIDIAPKTARYFEWLGNAQANEAQNANPIRQALLARRMKSNWEKAIALDPSSIEARESLIQFYVQAPSVVGGSREKAFQTAADIAKIDARRGALQTIALHERYKEWAEAERAVRELLTSTPAADRDALLLRLGTLLANSGQHAKAIEVFEPLSKTSGAAAPRALYSIGRVAAISGEQLDLGRAALERYLTLSHNPDDPRPANAHWRLGMIFERQQDKARARAEYEAAVQLDPSNKEIAASLKKLK